MTPELVLYTRVDCHLCEQFLLDFSLDFPSRLEGLVTRDVDADSALASAYGLRVPVLAVGDRVFCEGVYDRAKVAMALGL
jgi:hypothetical protein